MIKTITLAVMLALSFKKEPSETHVLLGSFGSSTNSVGESNLTPN